MLSIFVLVTSYQSSLSELTSEFTILQFEQEILLRENATKFYPDNCSACCCTGLRAIKKYNTVNQAHYHDKASFSDRDDVPRMRNFLAVVRSSCARYTFSIDAQFYQRPKKQKEFRIRIAAEKTMT